MAQEIIHNLITKTLAELELPTVDFAINHPEPAFGDYATNVALILAKQTNEKPQDLAERIKAKILETPNANIKDIQIAGPGFINFYLTDNFFVQALEEILANPETFGQNQTLASEKVMLEYTDPNPFKEFHIGHLMSNTVGESISRLIEENGAEVKRACYQGDVGMHVAKTLWGMLKLEAELPRDEVSLSEKVKFLGRAYAFGATEYKEGSANAKDGIAIINKKIYKGGDPKLKELYDLGRRWSLDYFETIYVKLGTKFDYYFFESETGELGEKMVEDGLAKNIFERSEGAVVFHGEKYDSHLHTRVFLNAEGLPTYEAKELGLAKAKIAKYPADILISVTGNEVDDYFRVVLRAMRELMPDLAEKIRHLSHGMLRLPSGKMSSRTGQVITAEALLSDIKDKVFEKIKDRELSEEEKNEISEKVAVGSIKYSILKQSIGKDIIFDFEKSLSFEGDSGPYLQYTYTRALSVLNKAHLEVSPPSAEASAPVRSDLERPPKGPTSIDALSRLLYQFPEVTANAYLELAPQHIASYLIEVASAFNSFYAQNKIIGSGQEAYFLALTRATTIVLKNGLNLLAIPVLPKM